MTCSSQLFTGIWPVCSFTETPSMPLRSRDHLLSNTGQTIAGQGCRAPSNTVQVHFHLYLELFTIFRACKACCFRWLCDPAFLGRRCGKDQTSHWRPWREHPAAADGASGLVYTKDTGPGTVHLCHKAPRAPVSCHTSHTFRQSEQSSSYYAATNKK